MCVQRDCGRRIKQGQGKGRHCSWVPGLQASGPRQQEPSWERLWLAGVESAGCLWGLCPVAGSSAILPEEQRGMKGRHTDVAPAGDRRPSQEMSCLAAGMKPPLAFGSFSQPPSPTHSFTHHRHTQMSIHSRSIHI